MENQKSYKGVIIVLIVNDFFSGNIMMCTSLFGAFYYNIVDGEVLDLMDVLFLVKLFNMNIVKR